MERQQAADLLQALGSKATSHGDNWVRGPCPLAPWLHKSGKDSKPSFGIYVAQGERSRFHCFSCESGDFPRLFQLITFHCQQEGAAGFHGDLTKAREIVANEEIDLPVLPGYKEFSSEAKKVFQPLPELWLRGFLPASKMPRAVEYLKFRGFDPDYVIKKWDLRYDFHRDMLMCPYRDVFGRFAGIRGRGIQFPGEPAHNTPHHDYVYNGINNAGLTWYNEEALNLEGPAVVVEGQFDTMLTAQIWPKTLGNLTAKPSNEKMFKLCQSDGVVLMLDGDKPGREATGKFLQFLSYMGQTKVAVVLLPFQGDEKTDPCQLGFDRTRSFLRDVGLPV